MGPARSASSHIFRVIMAIDRNRPRVTSPIPSTRRIVKSVPMGFLINVAYKHGNKHGAHIGREFHINQFADPAGNNGTQRHTHQNCSDVLHDVQAG
jgi:hypothetical protein